MNHFSGNSYKTTGMEFFYRSNPHQEAAATMTDGFFARQFHSMPPLGPNTLQRNEPNPTGANSASKASSKAQASTEAAVTEALLKLSSSDSSPSLADRASGTTSLPSTSSSSSSLATTPSTSPPPLLPKPQQPLQQRPSLAFAGPPLRRVSLCSPAGFAPPPLQPQWPTQFLPQANPHATPQRDLVQSQPVVYRQHKRPVMADDSAPPKKKVRTVSPPPATVVVNSGNDTASAADPVTVSCICPICNQAIKGLGDNKVDWSQPVQGRQRAKTITSIKKHVKDHHEQEPIWNVIVNSLDASPPKDAAANRLVTAQAFVTQALKKAALDQIPNQAQQLRSFRWTEKMIDQRVGIAKGFIQFGGQEYLRNKECHDETGAKINPKSLRNLAYSMLQTMYDDLMRAWNQHHATIEAAMATMTLGLLRNRFQLLFAAPDKWAESWYMDPARYS